MSLKFKDIKQYISLIDRVSICIWETLCYENYKYISEVPDTFDDFYLYGIGMIDSESEELDASGELNWAFRPCIEIMLSKEPRGDII